MDPVSALKSSTSMASLARKVYGKISDFRLARLFSAAGKSFDTNGSLSEEEVAELFDAALNGDNAEKIFQAAQKAILADSPIAVSLMGILLGKEMKGTSRILSSYFKVLRVLMAIQDDELHFIGRCAKVHFALKNGTIREPSNTPEPNRGAFQVVGPETPISLAAGALRVSRR